MTMWRHNKTRQIMYAPAEALTIKAANMANAVVKSSQEMGSLELRLVNSSTTIRRVAQKQEHHTNMHHVQKESVMGPTFATRLKATQLKITSSIRTMPTGDTTALVSSATITTSGSFSQTGDYPLRVFPKSSYLVILFGQTAGADSKRKWKGPSSVTTLSQSPPTMAGNPAA